MFTYSEPSYERVRRTRLLRLKYLNDHRCKEEEFAKALGVDVSTLKRIESGRERIDFSKASKILGVSIDYLMSGLIMAEDQFVEPIVHRSQIGSVMHACRIEQGRKGLKKLTLLAAAAALGKISSMGLKRIEELGSSKRYLGNQQFLCKVANLYKLPLAYVKSLVDASFPRGIDRKKVTAKDESLIRYIRKGGHIEGLVVLKGDLAPSDLESLKQRIEIEVDILRSKSHPK